MQLQLKILGIICLVSGVTLIAQYSGTGSWWANTLGGALLGVSYMLSWRN